MKCGIGPFLSVANHVFTGVPNPNGMRNQQCGWSGKTACATGRNARVVISSSAVEYVGWLVLRN